MNTRQIRFDARFEETSLEIILSGDLPDGPIDRAYGGPGDRVPVPIRLRSTVLRYEWDDPAHSLSYDYAALVAMLSYHPVVCGSPLGKSVVTFGWPVSGTAKSAFAEWEPAVEVLSDSAGAATVAECGSVIAFGGGIDSTALSQMFPEAELTHEVPLEVMTGGMRSSVHARFHGRKGVTFIYTNQRQLYDVWGLGSWPALFVAPLLLKPRAIMSAVNTVMGAFVSEMAGERMRTRYLRWYRLIAAFGPRMTSSEFMASLVAARIVSLEGLVSETAYCPQIGNDDCGACPKCLRRRVMFELADPGNSPRPLDDFTPSPLTLSLLESPHLYRSELYALAAERFVLPGWLATRVYPTVREQIGKAGYQDRYLASCISAMGYTDVERLAIEDRLDSWGVLPMTRSDRLLMGATSPANAGVLLSERFLSINGDGDRDP